MLEEECERQTDTERQTDKTRNRQRQRSQGVNEGKKERTGGSSIGNGEKETGSTEIKQGRREQRQQLRKVRSS